MPRFEVFAQDFEQQNCWEKVQLSLWQLQIIIKKDIYCVKHAKIKFKQTIIIYSDLFFKWFWLCRYSKLIAGKDIYIFGLVFITHLGVAKQAEWVVLLWAEQHLLCRMSKPGGCVRPSMMSLRVSGVVSTFLASSSIQLMLTLLSTPCFKPALPIWSTIPPTRDRNLDRKDIRKKLCD